MTHLLSANCYISTAKLGLFLASNIVFCHFQVANMEMGLCRKGWEALPSSSNHSVTNHCYWNMSQKQTSINIMALTTQLWYF